MSGNEVLNPGLRYKISANLGRCNDSNLFWHFVPNFGMNFGDWIGPYLFEKMTGQNPVLFRPKWATWGGSYYSTVGSILHLIQNRDTAIVWGSGAIRPDARFPSPKEILAVRGPLSREVCVQQGYKCPKCFGDPAVLLPEYIDLSKIGKTRAIGIVPHYVDFEVASRILGKYQDVKVIDVKRSVEDVVTDIASCELILSSSLHGLIVAHCFGVRAAWVQFSDRIIGGGFKFRDYYSSVEVGEIDPITISSEVTLTELINIAKSSPFPDIGRIALSVKESCPF